jgi:hypothetical protein
MPPQADMSPIATYRAKYLVTDGFFLDTAIACWDFLLSAQTSMRLGGDVLEIGVWKGKSAFLAACHMAGGQTLVLNDISPMNEVIEAIRAMGGPDVLGIQAKSSTLLARPELAGFRGRMRWIHVDGDHTGFTASNDLDVAELFLGESGVICVDDFFNYRYPQVTAMIFAFLARRRPRYRMFLCGARKAYICRAADFEFYDSMVRKYLGGHLRAAGISATIHRSTHAFDDGCFSIGEREQDRDYLGLDRDPSDLPA